MMLKFLLLSCFLFVFGACGSDTSTEKAKETSSSSQSKCTYGTPTAIFSADFASIQSHDFKQNGQKGVENVTFANGDILELLQDGCDEIRQEFRFLMPPDSMPTADSLCIQVAINKLNNLSKVSDQHAIFGIWAVTIDALKSQIQIGQALEPEPGTFITINRLIEDQVATLIILMERNS